MEACKKALQTTHNAFPVVNTAGKLVGLIPKSFIVKILEKKAFYDKESTDRSSMIDPNKVSEILQDPMADINTSAFEPLASGDNQDDEDETFDLDYDAKNGFPKTPSRKVLSWEEFLVDIYSSDVDNVENVILDVIEECYEEWIDLRPYMIEHPLTVTTKDNFQKILTQFRINHLRHLMVVSPGNGELRGVITRKDIFAYNAL